MHIFRSALSACVIKGLSDVEYYMPLDRDRLSEEGRKNIERNSRQNNNLSTAAVDITVTDNESIGTNRTIINNNNDIEIVDDDTRSIISIDDDNRRDEQWSDDDSRMVIAKDK